jgi:RND family efflux transporter MFP subunit
MLRLVIPVPERAVADIREGQTLEVNVSGLKRTFPGRIARYSDQIDPTTRTMHTEVTVPNPNYELVPGMYASVTIPLHAVTNVVTVPVQAIQFTGNGQATALVVSSSKRLERREIKAGLQTAAEVEVLAGLNEGDVVVFGEQNQFKEGQLVSPKFIEVPNAETPRAE